MADSSPQFGCWLRIGRWLALVLVLQAAGLRAAQLPVFRCALENWPARDYQAVIFHRGPLDMDVQDLVTAMKEAPQRWGANIATSTADVLEQMDEATLALWKTQTNAEPPWMVVLTPPNEDYSPVLWAGRFGADTLVH